MRWAWWVVMTAAACGGSSQYAAQQATGALASVAAQTAGNALVAASNDGLDAPASHAASDPRFDPSKWTSPQAGADSGTPCATPEMTCPLSQACAGGRSYVMMRSRFDDRDCRFLDSDGHRYSCPTDGVILVPQSLDNWCKGPRVVECGRGRRYVMHWPSRTSTASCYFDDSDGNRYPCDEATGGAPQKLIEWCSAVPR